MMFKLAQALVLGLLMIGAGLNLTNAAELKTITLSVDGMTCSVCPITVKKALDKVDGVTDANAVYDGDGIGWATVTYDADKTNVKALTRATENAGYPSHPRQ